MISLIRCFQCNTISYQSCSYDVKEQCCASILNKLMFARKWKTVHSPMHAMWLLKMMLYLTITTSPRVQRRRFGYLSVFPNRQMMDDIQIILVISPSNIFWLIFLVKKKASIKCWSHKRDNWSAK